MEKSVTFQSSRRFGFELKFSDCQLGDTPQRQHAFKLLKLKIKFIQ